MRTQPIVGLRIGPMEFEIRGSTPWTRKTKTPQRQKPRVRKQERPDYFG